MNVPSRAHSSPASNARLLGRLSSEPANLSMVARRSTAGVLARRQPTSTLARQTPQRGHVDFGLLDTINCNHEPGVARFLACRIIQPPVRGVSLPSNNWCYRECPRALMQVHIGKTNIHKLSRNRWPGFFYKYTHIYMEAFRILFFLESSPNNFQYKRAPIIWPHKAGASQI